MARTVGAVDLKKRKSRAKKKKRLSFNFKKYKPKTKDRDILKLYVFRVQDMSKEGLHNWKPYLRVKAKPTVYSPYKRIDVNVDELRNNKLIGEWAIRDIAEKGKFQVRAFGHAKNRFKSSARKIFNVTLTESPHGLSASVQPFTRLKRYRWFYNE